VRRIIKIIPRILRMALGGGKLDKYLSKDRAEVRALGRGVAADREVCSTIGRMDFYIIVICNSLSSSKRWLLR
jgi:hypothetical protein